MVDYTKPLRTGDNQTASLVTEIPGLDFPYVVRFTTTDGDEMVRNFNHEGDEQEYEHTIENIPQEKEEEETEGVKAGDGKADLPQQLQRVVTHTKRGRGTIVKVRNASADPKGKGRTMLIRLDGGGELWALPKNIQF